MAVDLETRRPAAASLPRAVAGGRHVHRDRREHVDRRPVVNSPAQAHPAVRALRQQAAPGGRAPLRPRACPGATCRERVAAAIAVDVLPARHGHDVPAVPWSPATSPRRAVHVPRAVQLVDGAARIRCGSRAGAVCDAGGAVPFGRGGTGLRPVDTARPLVHPGAAGRHRHCRRSGRQLDRRDAAACAARAPPGARIAARGNGGPGTAAR
jgi:hypothetical protein